MGRVFAGRIAGASAAAAVFLVVSAVPVIAASTAASPPGAGELPTARDVAAGIAQAAEEEAQAAAERQTPAATEEREESLTAFADLSESEAEQLLHNRFDEQIEALNDDPARFLSDATLEQVLGGGTAARVTDEGTSELLEAGIPVTARDGGRLTKVDLSLVDVGDALEPKNPLVPVTLPESPEGGIEVGDEGLAIVPERVTGDSEAIPFGDKNAFYHDVHLDTDLLASPVAAGVELSDQLRSAESPEELRFGLSLPERAVLQSDGRGGAEIVRGEETLARIPFPTAVDAQGATVPVELAVEESAVVLRVPHRNRDFAYPILVDPTLVEDWYNCNWFNGCNLQALGDGSWIWGDSGSGWIFHSTSCIWTCWGSGRGLFVSAESGFHGGGQFGQWTYTPPGGASSFITGAALNPFWRNNYANCPKSRFPQPHDYDGLWHPTFGWLPIETNMANDVGSAFPSGAGRVLVVGLGNAGSAAENKCRRDVMLAGAAVWITDSDVPTWNGPPTAPDQWTDAAVIPVSGSATDAGLGMKYFNLYKTAASGQALDFIGNAERGCSGLHASPCGPSWSSQIVNYNPAALPNGVNFLTVFAYDPLGLEHNSQGLPVHVSVDHSAPEVELKGSLFSGGGTHKGEVIGIDGSSASLASAQSGMRSLRFFFDDQLVGRFPDAATPPPCSNVQEGVNLGSCRFEVPIELAGTITGLHSLKVVAKDSLEHTTEKSVTINFPKDETPPSLSASGPLRSAAGLWLPGGISNVTLSANDGGTGVTEEAVFVDGVQVGQTATQGCFSGGCSLKQLFNVPLDGYGEGSHVVKAVARDGAGNKAEQTWTVKLDAGNPSLDSVTAPDLPDGWTPQVKSFTLKFTASDARSGIKKVEVRRPSNQGGTLANLVFASICTANCPPTVEGNATIDTTTMAQGVDNVVVKAYDASGRVSDTQSVTVFIDRSAPVLTATGPLVSAGSDELIGVATDLALTVQDTGSGVASVEALLDEEPIEVRDLEEIVEAGGTQTCKGESCELKYEGEPLVGNGASPGPHIFELVVRDWAGQSAVLEHEVQIDTRPPNVELSGPLVEAIGRDLENPIAAVEAMADDGDGEYDSGISSIEISVDEPEIPSRVALVVADQDNHRIEEFDKKGNFIRAFGSPGTAKGLIGKPASIALDAEGNIWVAERGNNRIQQFDQKGKFLKAVGSKGEAIGRFEGPEGIAIDPKGNIWVSDTYNGRVQKFNQQGEFIKVVGSPGAGPGQFVEPTAIDIGPDGKAWVTDWAADRVAVFNENGGFVRQFGTSGTGNGQFLRPDAIDVDQRGIVWVGDHNNNRVQAFDEQGEYLTQFGSKGTGGGQFNFGFPIGIAADADGSMWITDSNNHRLQKWSPPNVEASLPAYSSSFGAPGAGNGQFAGPSIVARDSGGNLWVLDQGNYRVEKFSETGQYLSSFGSKGSGNAQFSVPMSMAFDPSGNLWVVDGIKIKQFTPNGEFIRQFGVAGEAPGQLMEPSDIAINAAGHIFISDSWNGWVQEFTQTGTFLKVFAPYGSAPGSVQEPTGVAISPNGNVWIVDDRNHRVEGFTEAGKFIRQIGSKGSGDGQFERPYRVAVDGKGNVWVTDPSHSRVEKFTEGGDYLGQFGEAGPGNGQFESIDGITVSGRDIWIVDRGHRRVQRWRMPVPPPIYTESIGALGAGDGQFNHPGDVAIAEGGCKPRNCPPLASKSYSYDEATWGSGPHTVFVTATDGAGNFDVEQVRVNEPLNVVAPECPTASPTVLGGGQALAAPAVISEIESVTPAVLEPSERYGGETEEEPAESDLEPGVTREAPGVSLNELGIDVDNSLMGGGIEDKPAGAFTVGQAACLQPLQSGSAASVPSVVEGSAVVFPNSMPDTDTVVRPTASGTAIVTYPRGDAAPTKFSWVIGLDQDEELVELEDGSIAVTAPEENGIDAEEVPPLPDGGPDTLNDTEVQLAQARHDLAAANSEVEGAVTLTIAPPEVLTESGVVPGILRITGPKVVTAELPPNAVAETEAMIIRANPPAEPESICASVLARAPQYASRVCGEEEEDGSDAEDEGTSLGLRDLANTLDPDLNAEIRAAITQFENQAYAPGATASSGSAATETGQQKRFCEHGHEAECREFLFDGLQAAIAEERLFNISDTDSTQANAFRHAFWVALMHADSPPTQGHAYDGIAWALAHEEDQWKSRRPSVRRGSQMDILNNWVGWKRAGFDELASCEIMLKKATLHSIFIGAKRDPITWANAHHFEYFRPVVRKLRDPSGRNVYSTFTKCSEIGFRR